MWSFSHLLVRVLELSADSHDCVSVVFVGLLSGGVERRGASGIKMSRAVEVLVNALQKTVRRRDHVLF
jgi:hypothetical protein